MEKKINLVLTNLGVNKNYKGYTYLATAIKLCKKDTKYLTDTIGLYNAIAKEYGCTYVSVERCMRYAIEKSNYQMLGYDKKPSINYFIAKIYDFEFSDKKNSYRNTLARARMHDIDVTKVYIARELDDCLESDVDDALFEKLCEEIHDLYLSIDTYDINVITRAVIGRHFSDKVKETIEESFNGDIIEYICYQI